MQPTELLLVLGAALAVSLAYNVYQAWLRRLQQQKIDAAAADRAQLEQVRQELRLVRSDLAQERSHNEALSQKLSVAGRTRSSFLDHMGYYVRTPLNVIIGYSELLMSGVYGEQSETAMTRLKVIYRSGKDLFKYFTDMLDLHRLEIGGVELQRRPVVVTSLVERVAAEAIEFHGREGVEVTQDVTPNTPRIWADEDRVVQVLQHLTANALRFTHQGKVIISARGIVVRDGKSPDFKFPTLGWLKDGEWVLISVSDTGIGIPSEAQASIFETFFQVARNQTDEQRGIGLGLAIAKRLTELHGGTIWVKSTEAQGSTFHVALPVYRDARATDVHKTAAVGTNSTPPPTQ